jgi:hypothetical protein
MAADLLEVLDHLSWTKDRELHLCGISSACYYSFAFPCHVLDLAFHTRLSGGRDWDSPYSQRLTLDDDDH